MELQRGVCSLCAENTRVLTSSDAEQFSKRLPGLLYNILPETETIKNAIKICGICCYKIEIAEEAKPQLTQDENHVIKKSDACYFCNSEKSVMKVEKNWKYFTERTEHLVTSPHSVCVCPRCLFYFDAVFTFKTKLSYKFPQLATQKKKSGGSQKQNDTPKKRSMSNSPSSTKKRKIFDNCFDYLQPLCNNNYCIDDAVKRDKRMYKGIAYVNMKNAKNFEVNETPKLRPIIKIKLKPKGKRKHEKEKLVKSAEIPNKEENNKNLRRHSCIGINEKEKLDETPKSTSAANLVPKRRVSTVIDNSESQETKEVATEEMVEDTEKPVEETLVNAESTEETKEVIETNGIDKPEAENVESKTNSDVESKTNSDEEGTTESVNNDKEEITANEETESPAFPPQSPKNDISKLVESDSSEEDKNKNTVEQDGVERKKKRVTFSDVLDTL